MVGAPADGAGAVYAYSMLCCLAWSWERVPLPVMPAASGQEPRDRSLGARCPPGGFRRGRELFPGCSLLLCCCSEGRNEALGDRFGSSLKLQGEPRDACAACAACRYG